MDQKISFVQSDAHTENHSAFDEDITIFDESELLHRTLNDRDCAKEVVMIFIKNIPQQIETLRCLCNQNNMNEISSLGHLIKGSAANVAAHSIRTIAFKIETTAKENAKENAETLLNLIRLLEQEFKKLQDIIVKKYA